MSSGNIARLIFGLGCSVLFLIMGRNYLEYKAVIEKDEPVKYVVEKIFHKSSGRGRTYHMNVIFEGRSYSTDITSRIAGNIENNIFPDVYYVKSRDMLINNWYVTRSLRFVIVSFIVVVICIVPWGKINVKRKE